MGKEKLWLITIELIVILQMSQVIFQQCLEIAKSISYNIYTQTYVLISIKHKVDHQKVKLYTLKIQNYYLHILINLKCDSISYWGGGEGEKQYNFI